MVLDSIAPSVPRPGETLRVTGVVLVAGKETVHALRVALRLSRTPLYSRADLAAVAAGRSTSRDGVPVASVGVADRLAPGMQAPFDISVRLDAVAQLDTFGVYVLGVEATAGSGSAASRIGITRTFLPWVPRFPAMQPTRVAMIWPLAERPDRDGTAAFADDRLASDLAPGGRLRTLVDVGAAHPRAHLTWVIDPELVEAGQVMSRGYTVPGAAGTQVPGTGQTAAELWLAALTAAVHGQPVVPLPYADPDVVALHRAGLDELATSTGTAQPGGPAPAGGTRGGFDLAAALDNPDLTRDVALPPGGFVDAPTLAAMVRAGTRAVVLDAAAMPAEEQTVYTPSGRASLRGGADPVVALLYDQAASAALTPGRGDEAGALALQRFLAETAMITAELPNRPRTIVLTPPRTWAPTPAFADAVLATLDRAPWLTPVTLADVRATPPPELDRAPLTYPARARAVELPRSYLATVAAVRAQLRTLGQILAQPGPMLSSGDAALRRLTSAQWRGVATRATLVATQSRAIAAQQAKVRILGGTVTFGSRSGTIPLTVSNDLDQAVTVRLDLRPLIPRLTLRPSEPVTVNARRKRQVNVPADAVANGVVKVEAQLRTAAGTPFGDVVTIRVNVTQWGTVGVYVTLAAAGVLFAAAGVRVVQRLRGARESGRGARR